MRSRASSRCRLANVFGESGCGGRFGSSGSAPLAPGCWGGAGGGEAWPATASEPDFAAMEAGIGGDVVFLEIFARAGAEPGVFGGMAGLLSWYVER